MESLSEIYKKTFFSKRYKFDWRAVHIADALVSLFPKMASYIDVGCATGDIVNEMDKRFYDAWGIEGSRSCWDFRVTSKIILQDLREPFTMRRFCVCSCLEVAEHIEKEYVDIFLGNLTRLSDNLILSAAPPGQGGHYHVNCQPFKYWNSKLNKLGYAHLPILSKVWRDKLKPWSTKPGIKAFYQNTEIFSRKSK
jgi:hypothetical protein